MKRLLVVIWLALWLTACQVVNTPAPSPAPGETQTNPPAVSPSPQPTETSTPPPQRMVIYAPEGTNPAWVETARAQLEARASGAGVEVLPEWNDRAYGADVPLTLALAEPPALNEALSAAPQTRFVVLSAQLLTEAPNLTALLADPQHLAFTAGLTATVISDDWRAAGLIPTNQPTLQEAFLNGGRYFCGVCSPGWPLGMTFPLTAGVDTPSGGDWATTAAKLFDEGKVDVFYLSPNAVQPEVITYLKGLVQFTEPVRVLGSVPPPAELTDQWAVTLDWDFSSALEEALSASEPPALVRVPVVFTHLNEDLFTPGRQELVRSILAELQAGRIAPLSVP
ncbi:hypothetical protein [Anaerolinea thermophila]|uniref:ABC transporter substrate binding protein n=1 Tax=Anaerolinea thermophila (strain DSM 14523 / JCM 11388 / NBRC 100420 / UNI-1) TaxID=926569 RepID=E8N253_ANATU|nr:hypothetical protein [Anaerolinea thermophila]BAJ65000.1 hypothetical protein ANT_29740 [Anaerolinea thermophila UNI-1]